MTQFLIACFLVFTRKYRLLIVKFYDQYVKIKLLETVKSEGKQLCIQSMAGKGDVFLNEEHARNIGCVFLKKKGSNFVLK